MSSQLSPLCIDPAMKTTREENHQSLELAQIHQEIYAPPEIDCVTEISACWFLFNRRLCVCCVILSAT